MFNLGISELLIIGAIALMIFGPDKLPTALRSLSKFMTYIRRTTNDFKNSFDEELQKAAGDDVKEIKKIEHEIKNSLNHSIDQSNLDQYLEKAASVLDSKPNNIKDNADQTQPDQNEHNQRDDQSKKDVP